IYGTRLALNRHRVVEHFLEIALFQAAIGRKTLDAMFEALFANLELPRRILRAKAKQMGQKSVAWFDLGAPLDLPNQAKLSWDKAKLQSESHLSALIQPSANSSRNRSSTKAGSTGNRGSASGPAVFAQARCYPRNRAFS